MNQIQLTQAEELIVRICGLTMRYEAFITEEIGKDANAAIRKELCEEKNLAVRRRKEAKQLFELDRAAFMEKYGGEMSDADLLLHLLLEGPEND